MRSIIWERPPVSSGIRMRRFVSWHRLLVTADCLASDCMIEVFEACTSHPGLRTLKYKIVTRLLGSVLDYNKSEVVESALLTDQVTSEERKSDFQPCKLKFATWKFKIWYSAGSSWVKNRSTNICSGNKRRAAGVIGKFKASDVWWREDLSFGQK